MSVLLSLIIPVYNNEQYIKDCFLSVQQQSFRDFEVIVVDDGSTDGTARICGDFTEQDQRFRIIRQKNAGVSAARNRGMQEATGKYLAFADGDDVLRPSMLAELIEAAEREVAEIVYCGFTVFEKDIREEDFLLSPALAGEGSRQKAVRLVMEHPLYNSVWNKIYLRKFILENQIAFPEGIIIGEDALFNLKAYFLASKSYYVDKPLYIYCQRAGSAMNTMENKKNRWQLIQERCQIARELGLLEECLATLARQIYDNDARLFYRRAKVLLLSQIQRKALQGGNRKCFYQVKCGLYPFFRKLDVFLFRAGRKIGHIYCQFNGTSRGEK